MCDSKPRIACNLPRTLQGGGGGEREREEEEEEEEEGLFRADAVNEGNPSARRRRRFYLQSTGD